MTMCLMRANDRKAAREPGRRFRALRRLRLRSALAPGTRARAGEPPRFFEEQFFHYETLRLASYVPHGGADLGEIHAAVAAIEPDDEQSWYRAWNAMGERLEERASTLNDPISRGRALLRAHNYYRVAELLLPQNDEKRPAVYERSIDTFRQGLDTLGIEHEWIDVPYDRAPLSAIYYPGRSGAEERPLIVAGTGFDGTQEEIYFKVVAGALERGYSVLTYEGPGQGAPLRLHGLTFSHEWERPVGRLLDAFLAGHERPPSIVLLGTSFGGYLAPRAAAFEKRIDGVVALGVMYDFLAAAQQNTPDWARRGFRALRNHPRLLLALWHRRTQRNAFARWGFDNSKWTLGADDILDVVRRQLHFRLADVAPQITADVLILHGAEDHLVPGQQARDFEKSLTGARSVTTHVYGRERGGQEHCQQGANLLWQEDFFEWLAERFPGPAGAAGRLRRKAE